MSGTGAPGLAVHGVRFSYPAGAALHLPDFDLARGEAACLAGPSGSGKSTLLLLISGLLSPQLGRIDVAGTDVASLGGAARDRWRGRTIGIVLQSFQLLPRLTVLENLTAAQFFAGGRTDVPAALATLQALGIGALAGARPDRLSRGQVQRAAIARAVVNRPSLLLADEPTSSLDDETAAAALDLLLGESRRLGASLLIATHDRLVRAQVPRVIGIGGKA
jgi:putative ABC transport system ATP-binding protein